MTFLRLILILVVLLVPGLACGYFASRANVDTKLVGVWEESGSDDPLHIGFFSDGTFKAVYSSHRFETYHDFWGDWQTNDGTIRLIITGGNELPSSTEFEGSCQISDQELKFENIPLVEEAAGELLLFTYQGPAPKDRLIP